MTHEYTNTEMMPVPFWGAFALDPDKLVSGGPIIKMGAIYMYGTKYSMSKQFSPLPQESD